MTQEITIEQAIKKNCAWCQDFPAEHNGICSGCWDEEMRGKCEWME